ncbi:DUF6776 family protein, partial [Aeromonas dhakensis]|uniref:DUF6776 family protein n=1 Tax=Aeromonas dhakensis TaxID=196024 RepID=UPI0030C74720
PGRYHYRLALTQPAKKRELFRGQVQIKVEGIQIYLPSSLLFLSLLLFFFFSLFSLPFFPLLLFYSLLPEGFVPDRVRITISKDSRQPAQELLAEWGEVIKPLVVAPSAPVPAAQ